MHKNLSSDIKMGKKILMSGDIETEKNNITTISPFF